MFRQSICNYAQCNQTWWRENLINATDKIYAIINEYRQTKFPPGNLKVTADTSENTCVQLHDLINTVILGFIFVVFILMFLVYFTNASLLVWQSSSLFSIFDHAWD